VARAAERRVEDERGGRGVEADDRRDACDRRVRERLGDEDGPHGETGDDVPAQPRASYFARDGKSSPLMA
jgi:hypothetical protein